MSKHVTVYRNKHQGKTVDYSSMVGKTYRVFNETKSNYILHSSEDYTFVTVVPKRDCRVTDEPTINYKWNKN